MADYFNESHSILTQDIKVVGVAKVSQDEIYRPDPSLNNEILSRSMRKSQVSGLSLSVSQLNEVSHSNLYQTPKGNLDDELVCQDIFQEIDYEQEYKTIIKEREDLIQIEDEETLDWSKVPLYQKVLNQTTEFNLNNSHKILSQLEIPHFLKTLHERERDFKDYQVMLPTYVKSAATLKELLCELDFIFMYKEYLNRYKEMSGVLLFKTAFDLDI
eukprot:403356262